MEESINDNKRDYDVSLKQALVNVPNDAKNRIKKVYDEIKGLNIDLTKKKNLY